MTTVSERELEDLKQAARQEMTGWRVHDQHFFDWLGEHMGPANIAYLRAALSSPIGEGVREGDWQPIETAPRDGTQIIAWCRHPHHAYADDEAERARWEGPVIAHWIEHNGGGWTWHGHMGEFLSWQPLPNPPEVRSLASTPTDDPLTPGHMGEGNPGSAPA